MRNRKGQSILELAAVITLVTLGIFFAGPTIIRGINAHFKLWDDSIQDSYNDPMQKAPPLNSEQMPTNCSCSRDYIGSPGQNCGVSPCSATQRYEYLQCSPAGCGQALGYQMERCIEDSACCNIARDTPRCGETSRNVATLPPDDCYIGQRVMERGCGGNTTRFECREDSAPTEVDGNPSCVPRCIGEFRRNGDGNPDMSLPLLCANDDTNFPNVGEWVQDETGIGLPIRMAATGCTENFKCEVYCDIGYMASGLSCIPQNCQPVTKVFSYGAIDEKNTHHRILGDWDECQVTRCRINSSGTPGNCKLAKATCGATFTDAIPPTEHTSCWGDFCLRRYYTTASVAPGQWFVSLRIGANDRVMRPGDIQISCTRKVPASKTMLINICDDDYYCPVAANMSPGGRCVSPADNGTSLCDADGNVIQRSPRTSESCYNLGSYHVPVKQGDVVRLYKSNDGGTAAGYTRFTAEPANGCSATQQSLTINSNGENMVIPCDGYIQAVSTNDNIATTLTRQNLACCPPITYLVYADGDIYGWLFGAAPWNSLATEIPPSNRCTMQNLPMGVSNLRTRCTIEDLQDGKNPPYYRIEDGDPFNAYGNTNPTIDPNYFGLKQPLPVKARDVITAYANSESSVMVLFGTDATALRNYVCGTNASAFTPRITASSPYDGNPTLYSESMTAPSDGFIAICGGNDDNVAVTVARPRPLQDPPEVHLPDPGWSDGHNWDPKQDVNRLCQAFGFLSGRYVRGGTWNSPDDNGYYWLSDPPAGANYTFNNRTVPIRQCTNCGNDGWGNVYCKPKATACSQ